MEFYDKSPTFSLAMKWKKVIIQELISMKRGLFFNIRKTKRQRSSNANNKVKGDNIDKKLTKIKHLTDTLASLKSELEKLDIILNESKDDDELRVLSPAKRQMREERIERRKFVQSKMKEVDQALWKSQMGEKELNEEEENGADSNEMVTKKPMTASIMVGACGNPLLARWDAF